LIGTIWTEERSASKFEVYVVSYSLFLIGSSREQIMKCKNKRKEASVIDMNRKSETEKTNNRRWKE
jgi:hypothetical protein